MQVLSDSNGLCDIRAKSTSLFVVLTCDLMWTDTTNSFQVQSFWRASWCGRFCSERFVRALEGYCLA